MLFQRSNRYWQLKEFVQLGPEATDGDASVVPLQLLHFAGSGYAETPSAPLWFLSGFQGPARNDSHIVSLIQKAVLKATFDPAVDIFLTPVVNPTSAGKTPRHNDRGVNLASCFEDESVTTSEVRTLKRWTKTVAPKAVITFSVGSPMIRYLNAPAEVVGRFAELCEKSAYEFGSEPLSQLEDGTLVPREGAEGSFGAWCSTQGITWIDLTVDAGRKTFDELKDADWRPCVGPALKWLVEGFRFNPPKNEPSFAVPKVIPALEMPPEFANL